MTVFHTFHWQDLWCRNYNGSFERAAGKSIEDLQRPAVCEINPQIQLRPISIMIVT